MCPPPCVVESVPSLSGSPMPCLLFSHSTDDVQAFSTAPFNNEPSIRDIPALRGKTICGSQFGWIILLDKNPDSPDCYSITLWNPVTLKSVNLPPLNYHCHRGSPHKTFWLTSPPSDDNDNNNGDSNCFLFACLDSSGQAFVCRCQPRSGSRNLWYSQRMEIHGAIVILSQAVSLNGVIYAWACSGKWGFISIEIVAEDDASNPFTLTPMQLEEPELLFSDLLCESASHLVESCGIIYLLAVGMHSCDSAHTVKVWELDLQQGIWVEVKCLGDRAFFLGFNSTWCWASSSDHSKPSSRGVEGNCVYIYESMGNKGAMILVYSLNDCSLTLLPCGINDSWSKSGFWVMPSHCLFVAGQEGKKLIDVQDNDASKSCLTVSTTECEQLLQQNEPQAERLSELPRDLIEVLSRYMHLFDYWNFRCSSKLIQSASPLPLWRTNNVFPLFLVFEDDGGLCRLMDPCRDDSRSCIFNLYEDGHFDISFSKEGWLLVSYDDETIEFFNPFTRERGDFPDLINGGSASIGLSTNPTCSECLTVTIPHWVARPDLVIDYFKFGDVKWTSCQWGDEDQFGSPSGSPVFHSGAFYWLDKRGQLGVFEIVDDDPSWRVYDSPFASETRYFRSCYLVECGQSLFSVFIEEFGTLVEVFSFEQSEKRWVNVQTVGNYTLFLKSNSSTSVATSDTKMKNRIYLPMIQGNQIVYYSLEANKYYVNNTEASTNDFFFKKIPSRCCWI